MTNQQDSNGNVAITESDPRVLAIAEASGDSPHEVMMLAHLMSAIGAAPTVSDALDSGVAELEALRADKELESDPRVVEIATVTGNDAGVVVANARLIAQLTASPVDQVLTDSVATMRELLAEGQEFSRTIV